MNPSPPAVEIKNLHYSYDGAVAIQGVNLTVAAGSCHALFGRNGAGKTTTMKCLLNLLRPQAGSVRIFGLDPATQEIEVKRRIAYVPDSPAFYPWMTVRESIWTLRGLTGWVGSSSAVACGGSQFAHGACVRFVAGGLCRGVAASRVSELPVPARAASPLSPVLRRRYRPVPRGSARFERLDLHGKAIAACHVTTIPKG